MPLCRNAYMYTREFPLPRPYPSPRVHSPTSAENNICRRFKTSTEEYAQFLRANLINCVMFALEVVIVPWIIAERRENKLNNPRTIRLLTTPATILKMPNRGRAALLQGLY